MAHNIPWGAKICKIDHRVTVTVNNKMGTSKYINQNKSPHGLSISHTHFGISRMEFRQQRYVC